MSALPLFYCPNLTSNNSEVQLESAEARHVYGAKRLNIGAQINLTNGEGLLSEGEITFIDKKKQQVDVVLHTTKTLEPAERQVTLALAVPKGERQSTLLDMVTQLGVTNIVPLITDFSVSQLKDKSLSRWKRITVEASKQARRSWFPTIIPVQSLNTWVSSNGNQENTSLIMLDQNGQNLFQVQKQLLKTQHWIILIGPEGGFSQAEQDKMFEQGALAVTLGTHILRIETAAVAIISALNQIE